MLHLFYAKQDDIKLQRFEEKEKRREKKMNDWNDKVLDRYYRMYYVYNNNTMTYELKKKFTISGTTATHYNEKLVNYEKVIDKKMEDIENSILGNLNGDIQIIHEEEKIEDKTAEKSGIDKLFNEILKDNE